MSPDELNEARYERLREQVQKAILRDYPNPERKECPEIAILRDFAERPLTSTISDDDLNWKHVTHCSECYRDFLDLNKAYRERAKSRRSVQPWLVGAAISLFALASLIYLWRGIARPTRHQNAEFAYAQQTIDLPSMTRSGDLADVKPIVLRREPNRLTVQLPVGSEAGRYEFQLQAQNLLVLSAEANAEVHNGITAFTIPLDFSKLHSGDYMIVIRHVPFDWHYPVIIR